MKRILMVLVIISVLIAATGCSKYMIGTKPVPTPGQKETPKPPIQGITVNHIAFDVVDLNSLSDSQKAQIEELKSQKGYIFWQENDSFYIAIFAGEKPTAGHAINVTSIEDNEGKTNVSVEIIAPNSIVNQVITYPYVIVKTTGITDNFSIVDAEGNKFNLIGNK